MLNSVNLTGRLVRDPELRYTPGGVAVANVNIAVQRSFTNAEGEREADFPSVVIFNKQAENVANYLTKGSLVAVEGRIQTRKYENDEGKMIYVTEVVANAVHFLESKKEEQGKSSNNNRNNKGQSYTRGGKR
jgi:single-strand DNA-binding protein